MISIRAIVLSALVICPVFNYAYASSSDEAEAKAEEPPIGKMRTIPAGSGIAEFKLGETQVTQGQWQSVMGRNPSKFKSCGPDCPVEQVSWSDTQDFIRKLNSKTGKSYRLPTEEEWRHACLGGKPTGPCNGDEVAHDNYRGEGSKDPTRPVKRNRANEYGLHDMGSNVFEWTSSILFSDSDVFSVKFRIVRGGRKSTNRDEYLMFLEDHRPPPNPGGAQNFGFRLAH